MLVLAVLGRLLIWCCLSFAEIGGPYCLSQVVWGLGIKPIYQDYVDLKQWSFTALRDWLIEEYNVTTARSSNALVWDEEVDAMGGLDPGYLQRRRQAGVPLKALYFHRVSQSRTSYTRRL